MDEYFLLNQYVSIWQIPVKITFGFLLRVFLGEIITTPRRLLSGLCCFVLLSIKHKINISIFSLRKEISSGYKAATLFLFRELMESRAPEVSRVCLDRREMKEPAVFPDLPVPSVCRLVPLMCVLLL